MLSKSFKPAKCKTSLKLAVARIKLLRNKREAEVKKMRRELAQLLGGGQEKTALIRVEHVIREEKTMSAYELIELYCELIVARLPIIESQKSCPIDLKEAVCSVIFASPRCADVPELMDIRKHFSAKYGKEFIHSALEVRPDCGVSRMVVEKLSAWAPDAETKIKSLTAIAQEHNVKWDSKTFEEQLKKPHDDLLNGPTAFSSASKTPMELSSVKYSTASAQTNESRVKMPQDDSATRPTAFNNTFSGTTTRTNSSVPFTFQSDSGTSERKLQGREINNLYPREENASMNWPTWNMEFEDATTAAQAAAESAEKASFAARAAAELASRGRMSRQNSTASNESSTYSNIYERPEKLRAFMGKNAADESVSKGSDEIKSSQGIKPEQKHVQKDERVQGISRREAARTSDNDYPTGLRAFHQSSSPSSQGFVNDILDSNRQKDDPEDYSQAQRISFASEVVESSHQNMRHESVVSSQKNINVDPINEHPYHYVSDEEKLCNSNIYRHENDEGKTSRMSSFGNNQKQSTAGYSSGVVFDYSLDAEDSSSIFGKKRGNLFDQSQGEESSTFQSDKVTFSVDLNGSGSIGRNSGSKLHLFTEPQTEEHLHPETMTKGSYPPQPAFDVSDRENTESEDESTFRSNHTYMRKTNEAKEAVRNSGAYDGKNATVSDADKFYNRYGADSVPDSLPSLRSDKAPSNLNLSARTPSFRSSDEEEPQPLRLTKRQPTKRTEGKEKSRMQSIRLDTETSEVSNEFIDEGGQGINFGRLTVGFKQRSFPRPPYIKSTAVDSSHLSDKQSASFQVADQERYNQQSYPKAYASKSRTSGVSIDSHSETSEKLAANCSAEDINDSDKRHFVPQNAKITDVDVLAHESYYTKSRRKGYKEISSNFQGDDPLGNEHTHYVRRYSGSTSNQQQQSIHISPEVDKKQVKSSRESSSKMAYLDSDAREAKLDPDYITGSRVELSHRTRDEQSQSNSSFSGVTEPLSSTNYDAVTVQGKVSSNKPVKKNPSSPKQTSSILEELSKSQLDSTDNRVLKHDGNTKYSISSGESVSHESSLKKASHTHPKLPDYDSLAAYFHSLRSNRR